MGVLTVFLVPSLHTFRESCDDGFTDEVTIECRRCERVEVTVETTLREKLKL